MGSLNITRNVPFVPSDENEISFEPSRRPNRNRIFSLLQRMALIRFYKIHSILSEGEISYQLPDPVCIIWMLT